MADLPLPDMAHKLGDLAQIELQTDNTGWQLNLVSRLPIKRVVELLEPALLATFSKHIEQSACELSLSVDIASQSVQAGLEPLAGVRNIVAIASGKGGVGKSTTAANLALALKAGGARVGLLDADIYGPSVPQILGLADSKPESEDGKTLIPPTAYGLVAMSIGFLVDPNQAMAWRGPMVTQALNQLLAQTQWGELDYLIVDMPPGTGDIQLTLSQRVPLSGALIVTTPQDLALLDARKGLELFRKVQVPVLGLIENMSQHICSNCGQVEAIFGEGGAQRLGSETASRVIASLPLDVRIRQDADRGRPSVVADPEGAIAAAYASAALEMALELANRRESHAHKFPKIVVEETA